MDINKEFWPGPLAHCALPVLGPTDERVIIAETTSDPANGFKGNRFLYSCGRRFRSGRLPDFSSMTGMQNTGRRSRPPFDP